MCNASVIMAKAGNGWIQIEVPVKQVIQYMMAGYYLVKHGLVKGV